VNVRFGSESCQDWLGFELKASENRRKYTCIEHPAWLYGACRQCFLVRGRALSGSPIPPNVGDKDPDLGVRPPVPLFVSLSAGWRRTRRSDCFSKFRTCAIRIVSRRSGTLRFCDAVDGRM